MKLKTLVVFGAGGHAKVVVDIAEKGGAFQIVGVVDAKAAAGTSFMGYPLVDESRVDSLEAEWAIVAIGDNWSRAQVVAKVVARFPRLKFATLIHPTAQAALGRLSEVGVGTVLAAGAVVNPNASIGSHCIINTSSIVEHDCKVGNYASTAPGAVLGGASEVGEYSAISLNAVVLHGVQVGAHSVVGAGSVVVEAVPNNSVGFGVPFRFVRSRQPGESYL